MRLEEGMWKCRIGRVGGQGLGEEEGGEFEH